jgi:hypothetical protein
MSESDGQSGSTSKLEFVTKHYVVFSTLFSVGGVILSTLFVTSYLSIFDSSLVWLIELSDLAKFGVIFISILAGLLGIVQFLLVSYQSFSLADTKVGKIIFGIMVALGAVTAVFLTGFSDYPYEQYIAFLSYCLSTGVVVSALVLTISILLGKSNRKPVVVSAQVLMMLGVASILAGGTYGTYIKDLSQTRHEVQLKDCKLDSALPVLILSHHSIYKMGDSLIVLPASDIQRISIKKSRP